MNLPVASRTREKEALRYRKLHEEIKRKNCEDESYSSSKRSRGLKISSNSSCNNGVGKHSSESMSFSGIKQVKAKGKGRRSNGRTQNHNVSKDFGFDDDSAKDSNLGVADHPPVLDLGSSNFECDDFGDNHINKIGSVKMKVEVEESSGGTKYENSGTFDGEFVDQDEVIEISDGDVEFSSDGESDNNEVREISGDDFEISSSGESEDDHEDEDYREEHFETEEHFEAEEHFETEGHFEAEEHFETQEHFEAEENFKAEENLEASVSTDGASSIVEISSGDEAEKREVPSKKLGERGKREKIEPPLTTTKRLEASFDSDDSECDVIEVGLMSKKKKPLYQSKSRNKIVDVAEILGNSMFFEDGEEEVIIPQPEPPKGPLKFTFGTEEPIQVEKSEEEKEMDRLWAEMDLALCAHDDATYNAMFRNEAESSAKVGSTVAHDCSQGKHALILDEEIGLVCKYCPFVQQEIRYHTAPFNKNPFGRSERRDSYHEHIDGSRKLHLHDFGNDTPYGDDFNSNVRGTVWNIIPGIEKDLHPHQRDGFVFLWKNIGGGIELDKLEETDSDKVGGCIISHAPGTGKTRLAIVFLQTYMKMYPSCKPVIIAPCGMLLYWESEFKKWNVNIPFHNLNHSKLSGKENEQALKLTRNTQLNVNTTRMLKLYSWKKDRSVLALSYQLFKELVGEDTERKTKDARVQKVLLEVPSLLFLDEGHTPRNDQSQIFKALSRLQTKKRVILSGTPFQNTFDELFNTICLVRLQISDLFSSNFNECVADRGLKHYEKKLWKSLVGPIGKEDTNAGQEAKRLAALRDMIRPFVHVHAGNILQQKLPGLRDAVIVLQPDEFQKGLLGRVVENKTNFELEYLTSLVSLHPALLPEYLVDKENPAESGILERRRLDADAGVKTKFLMELIRISERLNEKVLVFSQYIDPLEFIRDQLIQRFNWSENREIIHMHGKTTAVDRQSKIKIFNNAKSEAKVMLASTKACSEGISLVGASRVVLVDVVWNPQVERQAISRAYRLGQTKVVYIYHLITCGTSEEEKYRTQARKERLSDLVFYSPERTRNHKELSSKISDDKKDKILESIVEGNKLKDILKKIIYEPKANLNDDLLTP